VALGAALLVGCGGVEEKVAQPGMDYGPEEGIEGKEDSATYPASIVRIAFGEVKTATFTSTAHFRAFKFTGRADQKVDLYVDGLRGLDTVLYLYKVSKITGKPFGTPLASNDDTTSPGWRVTSNTTANELSSSVADFKLPENRDYALVATTYRQRYRGTAEVVVKSPGGMTCGGIASLSCPEGLVCMYAPYTCTMPDAGGTCQMPLGPTGFRCPPPNPNIDNRVCGCDGNTYADACQARLANASVASDGPCRPAVCVPECRAIGSRSEGWYDTCTDQLIRYANCSACYPYCTAIGSRSERWTSSCGGFIRYDNCSQSENQCLATGGLCAPVTAAGCPQGWTQTQDESQVCGTPRRGVQCCVGAS
jgi:hypothetical protein